MKCLVTGGAEFIGALMGELQDRNEDVTQLSREKDANNISS
jgi:nucleoside-diphosphate-sugar epimerase